MTLREPKQTKQFEVCRRQWPVDEDNRTVVNIYKSFRVSFPHFSFVLIAVCLGRWNRKSVTPPAINSTSFMIDLLYCLCVCMCLVKLFYFFINCHKSLWKVSLWLVAYWSGSSRMTTSSLQFLIRTRSGKVTIPHQSILMLLKTHFLFYSPSL